MNPLTHEVVRISRAFGAFEREAVCCGTVTVSQCLVLQELLRGGPADVTTLATFAGASPSAMTRLIDGLERRDWVARERDPADRRRAVATLTEAGRAEAQRLVAMSDQAVARVLAYLPVAERAATLAALRLVADAMEQARADGAGVDLCC